MLALLSLIACSPYAGSVDPWTEARAACAESSADCEAIMADHLGLPDDADLDDPLLVNLLDGMHELLIAEPRPVSELGGEAWLSPVVLDELTFVADSVEGDHSGQALYDLVAVQVRRTAVEDTVDDKVMAFRRFGHLMRVHPENADWMQGPVFAHALVHEAAHALTPIHVACPWWGEDDRSCDAGWDGAYAFQVAAAGLLAESCTDGPSCGAYIFAREEQQDFILGEE